MPGEKGCLPQCPLPPCCFAGCQPAAEHPTSLPSLSGSCCHTTGPPGEALRLLTPFSVPSSSLPPLPPPLRTSCGHLPMHWEGHQRHPACPVPGTQYLTLCFEATVTHAMSPSLPPTPPEAIRQPPVVCRKKRDGMKPSSVLRRGHYLHPKSRVSLPSVC